MSQQSKRRKLTTTRFDPDQCPVCEHRLDAASAAFKDGARPREGDITVCCYCTMVLTFKADLRLEVLDTTELPEEIKREIELVRAAIHKFRKEEWA